MFLLDFEGQLADLDGLVELSHLDVAGGLVIVVEKFSGFQVDSLLVAFESLLEIFFLVEIVSFDLLLVSLIQFWFGFLWFDRFFLLFGWLTLRLFLLLWYFIFIISSREKIWVNVSSDHDLESLL